MAVVRSDPYGAYNFLVDLGDGAADGPDGGFCEVSGLESWLDVSEYRTGSFKSASLHKVTGLARTADVTLKRGIIGSLGLYQWFNAVRNGDGDLRTVTIMLLDETRKPVMTWKLIRARPVRYAGPQLKADGNEVAMEELTLAYERLEME